MGREIYNLIEHRVHIIGGSHPTNGWSLRKYGCRSTHCLRVGAELSRDYSNGDERTMKV